MDKRKNLYRSRNAVVGGVGAGVADYFSIDPVVVRILTVILTVLTGGLLAVAYVALWLILPKEPKDSSLVEVQPQEVCSETYGVVACATTCCPARSTHKVPPEGVATASAPPVPPAQYANAYAAQGSVPASSVPSYHAQSAEPAADKNTDAVVSPLVRASLWLGFLLLSFGAAIFFGSAVVGVDWWQFWPILLVIFGIGQMIIPGSTGKKMSHFTVGLMLFSAGAVILPVSLGLLEVESLYLMFFRQWPFLLLAAVFFVVAKITKISSFTLCGGLLFAAFCFFGVIWWGIPTAADTIIIELFGKTYLFDAARWV